MKIWLFTIFEISRFSGTPRKTWRHTGWETLLYSSVSQLVSSKLLPSVPQTFFGPYSYFSFGRQNRYFGKKSVNLSFLCSFILKKSKYKCATKYFWTLVCHKLKKVENHLSNSIKKLEKTNWHNFLNFKT
jgi:hypothetical protein